MNIALDALTRPQILCQVDPALLAFVVDGLQRGHIGIAKLGHAPDLFVEVDHPKQVLTLMGTISSFLSLDGGQQVDELIEEQRTNTSTCSGTVIQ